MKQQARVAIKWSAAAEIVSKVIQPISFLLLALFLTPEEYGLIAAGLVCLTLAQIFGDAGIGKAYIQFQSNDSSTRKTATTISVLLGCVAATGLYLSSDWIARSVFVDGRVGLVVKAMAPLCVLTAASAIPLAEYQRTFGFKKIFILRIATVTLPAIISIGLAAREYGHWSIIYGTYFGALVQLAIIVFSERPRFGGKFCVSTARKLFKFGFWVLLSSLITWLFAWFDALVVTANLGVREAGIYRTGSQITGTFFSLLIAPILPVLYSHMSRMSQDSSKIASSLQHTSGMVSVVSVPLCVLFVGFGPAFAVSVLDDEWNGIGNVIIAFAIVQGISIVASANGEAYRAAGKPERESHANIILLFAYIPTYLITIKMGLDAFLISRGCLAILALIVHLFYFSHVFEISMVRLIAQTLIPALLGVGTIGLAHMFFDDWVMYSLCALLACGFSVILSCKLNPSAQKEVLGILSIGLKKLLRA